MSVPYLDPLTGSFARSPLTPDGRGGEILYRPAPVPQPCACGTLTTQRYVCDLDAQAVGQDSEGADLSVGSIAYRMFPSTWQMIYVCAGCERRRNRAQAEAIAGNPNVYPHIRERMAAYLGLTAGENGVI